jgi:hypothetical protein
MATKKKTKKKLPKSRKPSGKKAVPKKKPAKKTPKKLAKKKAPPKKAAAKNKPAAKRTASRKAALGTKPPRQGRDSGAAAFSHRGRRSMSGEESGDLQGLSNIEAADSESVDELLEEGNAFEADVVSGVEAADNADEEEVHTHEVPEDDVPAEYLDED